MAHIGEEGGLRLRCGFGALLRFSEFDGQRLKLLLALLDRGHVGIGRDITAARPAAEAFRDDAAVLLGANDPEDARFLQRNLKVLQIIGDDAERIGAVVDPASDQRDNAFALAPGGRGKP